MAAPTQIAPYSYRADPAVPPFADDRPVIIFDGYCALCSGAAQFILRHDRVSRFRLLPAQTPLGTALYRHYGLDTTSYATFVLIDNGVACFRSDAALCIAQGLGWPWRGVAALRMVPRAWRDEGYDFIARHRLRLFGRREACFMPRPGDGDRFLG